MYLTPNEFKDLYCEGSQAKFAKRFGRVPQHVTHIFREPEKWAVMIENDRPRLYEVKALGRSKLKRTKK